jgi:hypothetical protein
MNLDCVGDMKGRGDKTNKLMSLAELKLGLRPAEAAFLLGSTQLLAELVAAQWLKPVVNRHKLLLYDKADVNRAWARLLSGEQPPKLQRKSSPATTGRKESH